MPPEETLITRDGALDSSTGTSSVVSRNGPNTLMASVSSIPSADSDRSRVSRPALLTSTSSLGDRSANSRAKRLTELISLRSQVATSSSSWPVRSAIRARARSPRSTLRTTSHTVAPSRAKPAAAASPSPEVAPVTITTSPSMRRSSESFQCGLRRA